MPRIAFLVAGIEKNKKAVGDVRAGIEDAKNRDKWKRIAHARFVAPGNDDVRVISSPKQLDRAPEGSKLYRGVLFDRLDDKVEWERQIKFRKMVLA
jgi:hypothetical protein